MGARRESVARFGVGIGGPGIPLRLPTSFALLLPPRPSVSPSISLCLSPSASLPLSPHCPSVSFSSLSLSLSCFSPVSLCVSLPLHFPLCLLLSPTVCPAGRLGLLSDPRTYLQASSLSGLNHRGASREGRCI